ncbi:MAG: hypothetical protein IPQ09_02200 [Myxococcales bacterium]|nr:hypothetical protein [Myxococcales bacterium]HQY60859.1 MYXO-CTERM sorting domain-containing protein [Polyangiaceae bacterium]
MSRMSRFTAALVALALALGARESLAACPVGLAVKVDNDLPGSGYSEVKPENWESHNVDACHGTYRYLSQYIGDRTRKGKAIWQPRITVAGFYEVTASYRGSVNRTNDADYTLYDDKGLVTRASVDQSASSGCTRKAVGTAFCAVGGACRLVLDGDDGKSDAADEATFVLKACEVPDAGVPDAGVPDAGVPDASMPDAATPSQPDAGVPDASMPDASRPESREAGTDTGPPPPNGADASSTPRPLGEPRTLAPPDDEGGCSSSGGTRGAPAGSALLVGSALLLGSRRRRR